MVKTGICPAVPIDGADGEEAGKLVRAWGHQLCGTALPGELPGSVAGWGWHPTRAGSWCRGSWEEGLGGRSFWAAKIYRFQDLVLHLKCKVTNRSGGWMLPLSSAAGTKPWGSSARGLGRSCGEPGCLRRKAAPRQASSGARPRRS